jgi:anti-sigma regulatory factor (Ser/Thr protein kinase)
VGEIVWLPPDRVKPTVIYMVPEPDLLSHQETYTVVCTDNEKGGAAVAGPASPLVDADHQHVAHFYADEAELTRGVGGYLGGAIEAGEACLVVATQRHRRGFEGYLNAGGAATDRLVEARRLILVDAEETLSQFMVDGHPDPARFDASMGSLVRTITAGGRTLRAYGEMVAILWDAGQVNASIELEELWNDLLSRTTFSLYCAYPASSSDGQESPALGDVCRLHSAIVGNAVRGGEEWANGVPIERSFERTVSAPFEARRFVGEVLGHWGEAALLEEAALVATELVTNAVMHGQSGVTVQLSATAEGVRISVADTSLAMPAIGCPSDRGSSGRGLNIVSELASSWGTEGTVSGKMVWAELRR